MATITERLKWIIEADAHSAIKGFEETGAAAEAGLGKAQTHADKLGGKMVKTGAGMTAFAGIAGAALFETAKKFEETALKAGEFSDATGLSVEDASRLIQVSKDIGVGADTVESALGKMNKTLGNSPQKFADLGIEIARTKSGTEDVNGTFLNVIDRLNKIEDPAKRAATAAGVFGKGWQGAAELIGMSTDDIRGRLAAVSDAKVINEEELKKAKEFRDDIAHLKQAMSDFVLEIGQGAMPVLGGFVKGLGGVAKAISSIDDVASGAAGGLLASGAAMTGVIGISTLLAGQLLKLKTRWAEMGDTAKLATVGIGIAMLAYTINASQAAKAQQNLNDQFAKLSEVANADLYREFTDAIVKGMFASKNLDETLQGLAHTNLEGAQRVRDYIKALIEAGTATAEQKRLYGDLSAAIGAETIARKDATEAIDKYKGVTDESAQSTKDDTLAKNAAKIATDAVKTATQDATDKAKAFADALQTQRDRLDALYPKAHDAAKAAQDYADSQANALIQTDALNATLLNNKATQDDVRTATLSARDAIEDQAAKFATLDGAAAGSEGAIRREIQSLKDQESTLAPGSPLRAALDQYIAQLESIPSNISTILDLHVSQSGVNPNAPGYAPRSGGPHLASGGIVQATPGGVGVTVAEGGVDEAIIPLDGDHGLGGGTSIGVVNIHMPVGSDGNDVVRAIQKFERRNGPGWRA